MKEILGYLIFIAALLAGIWTADAIQCGATAEAMGFRSDYTVLTGCLIEPTPGQWVPLKNYRVTE
jgi:hypothetical protein